MSKKVSKTKPASSFTRNINKAVSMPVDDEELVNSKKGFIAGDLTNNKFIVDMHKFKFTEAACPDEVNPSLWRQAQLNNGSGLFKVSECIYQIRGYDIANMTVIEGDNGIIIIDTLISAESAKCALELYYSHRPFKPIAAVIYTHSHADHFGGVKGIITDEIAAKIEIIAPSGFMQHTISENIYAGNAMSRRAAYMYGFNLDPCTTGLVDNGVGKAMALGGTVTLRAPTKEISMSGTELRIVGVKLVFQLTPGTEAPAEMNIYLPELKALCLAENSSKTLHNFYTLRGAEVRDSKAWAMYYEQSIEQFGDEVEVMFTQHTWPTWGNKQIIQQLENQRDEILFIHDQTLRLANMGYTPNEIANALKLPDELYRYGYVRGYYGTIRHNSKAVYQKYLGFYDGNPVNLDPLPESEAAAKIVEYMGGSTAIIEKAITDYAKGNYQWVATVMNYVVFADPDNKRARELEADALEQLGYQAEAATWRNEYLSAALELREAPHVNKTDSTISPDMAEAMTVTQFFDNMAIHLNPEKVKGVSMTASWVFTDLQQEYTTVLKNSVLRYKAGTACRTDIGITLTKALLNKIITGQAPLQEFLGQIQISGDKSRFKQLFDYFDTFNPIFNIVLP